MSKIQKKYGSWPSQFSTELIATAGHRFGHLTVDNGNVYWVESLPEEKGRQVIFCAGLDGEAINVTPEGYSVRTRVHEYGGADFSVSGENIIFSNDDDQRLYLQQANQDPRPITPEPDFKHAARYADIEISKNGQWLICIRERHPENGEPLDVINEIVRISIPENIPQFRNE